MKLLSLIALFALGCTNPIEPRPRTYCTHGSEFTWQPILDAAGDTVLLVGVCAAITP